MSIHFRHNCKTMLMKSEHRKTFLTTTWINVLGNALKIFVEGGVGFLFGSLALIADAAQSIADLVASLVILIWGRRAYDAPDRTHPHGHAPIEPLTALFTGALLVLIGLKTGYDSVLGLLSGPDLAFNVYLLGATAFAAADMAVVYYLTVRANRDMKSPSLRAMAQDCLSDLLFTGAVFVGVGGVAFGYPALDPLAGGAVSLLVVFQGIAIGYENINYLAGAAPPYKKQKRIRQTILDHPDARGIHDFAAFYVGPVIEVECHLEIDGDLTLKRAHDIETEVMNQLLEIEDVHDVHIHLDPAGIGEWRSKSPSDGTP